MARGTYHYRGETETLDDSTRATLPGQFVQLPDGFVHYELAGPQDGETVVLVPGMSVAYHVWDPTFAALSQAGFRVLRFDLYGRGFSDRPDTTYNLDLFDRQIECLLAALGLNEPVTLVGLSMGGAIVATFASRHPEHIRRLVLVDPLASPLPVPAALRVIFIPGVGERLMDWFGDSILVGGQPKDFCEAEHFTNYQDKYRPAMKYQGFKRAILATLRSILTWDITGAFERVGQLSFPVLLFWGRQDQTIPLEKHREVLAAIPRTQFHAIDRAGHIPHYERPEVVNPVLIEFLS